VAATASTPTETASAMSVGMTVSCSCFGSYCVDGAVRHRCVGRDNSDAGPEAAGIPPIALDERPPATGVVSVNRPNPASANYFANYFAAH